MESRNAERVRLRAERAKHCLHVVLNEEWQHHRYAVRDLAVLETQPR